VQKTWPLLGLALILTCGAILRADAFASCEAARELNFLLQATPMRDGKFFVQDAAADGILSALPGSGAVDVLLEDGGRQTLFNGDMKGQELELTTAEYNAKLATTDAKYARLLALLTSAANKTRQ